MIHDPVFAVHSHDGRIIETFVRFVDSKTRDKRVRLILLSALLLDASGIRPRQVGESRLGVIVYLQILEAVSEQRVDSDVTLPRDVVERSQT